MQAAFVHHSGIEPEPSGPTPDALAVTPVAQYPSQESNLNILIQSEALYR